jgi:hypothetical protein
MESYAIALFGEAERGEFTYPYSLHSLAELERYLGTPPAGTYGLYFAIKSLLLEMPLLFIRVKEEGYGLHDYLIGAHSLEKSPYLPTVQAIGLPGVSDKEIFSVIDPLLFHNRRILITTEPDLYDFLTSE